MSDLPSRIRQRSDQDDPSEDAPGAPGTGRPVPPAATGGSGGEDTRVEPLDGPDEEATRVHETAPRAPGAVDPADDPGITGFTPSPASPALHGEASGDPAAQRPAADQPAVAAVAAAAPAAAPRKVNVRNRGRMRRRLRYLRRVRELGYRDLGGLVFELRRVGAENEVLVGAKVDALHAIDQELHVLEHGLRDFRSVEELHEPGVSVCLRCGALHGSDANFCPQCGTRVDLHGPQTPGPAEPATVVTAPASGQTGTMPAQHTGTTTGGAGRR